MVTAALKIPRNESESPVAATYTCSVMGCSICGTKGVVFTVFTEHTSGSLV